MAGERDLYFGADATDATYRVGDDDADSRFVLAEDTNAGTILLEYDEANSEWVSRGPVNLDGNNISNVGDLEVGSTTTTQLFTLSRGVDVVIYKDGSDVVADGGDAEIARDTDAATVFQAAYDHLDSDSGGTGGKIYFTAEVYSISSTITPKRHVTLESAGRNNGEAGGVLKAADGLDDDVIATNYSSDTPCHNEFIGFGIDGNKSNNTSGHGLRGGANARDATVRDVWVNKAAEDGIRIENGWGWTVDACITERAGNDGLLVSSGGKTFHLNNHKSNLNDRHGYHLRRNNVDAQNIEAGNNGSLGLLVTSSGSGPEFIDIDAAHIYTNTGRGDAQVDIRAVDSSFDLFVDGGSETTQAVLIDSAADGIKLDLETKNVSTDVSDSGANTERNVGHVTPTYRLTEFHRPKEGINQTTTSTSLENIFILGGAIDVGNIPEHTTLHGRFIIGLSNDTSSETTTATPKTNGSGTLLSELEVSATGTGFQLVDSGWTEITSGLSGIERDWRVEGKVSAGTGEFFANNVSLFIAADNP